MSDVLKDPMAQALSWLRDDIESDEFSTPGFKTVLADTLMNIEIATQLTRIADLLKASLDAERDRQRVYADLMRNTWKPNATDPPGTEYRNA